MCDGWNDRPNQSKRRADFQQLIYFNRSEAIDAGIGRNGVIIMKTWEKLQRIDKSYMCTAYLIRFTMLSGMSALSSTQIMGNIIFGRFAIIGISFTGSTSKFNWIRAAPVRGAPVIFKNNFERFYSCFSAKKPLLWQKKTFSCQKAVSKAKKAFFVILGGGSAYDPTYKLRIQKKSMFGLIRL